MITATKTRKLARKALRGKWGLGFFILFLNSLIIGCFAVITKIDIIDLPENSTMLYNLLLIIFEILVCLITIPLEYGLIVTFMKMRRLEDIKVFEFCKIGFGNFTRSLKVYFWTLLKMILPIILLSMFLISLKFAQSLIYNSERNTFMIDPNFILIVLSLVLSLAFIFLIVGLTLFVIKTLTYIYAINISYDEPEITAKEAVQKSKEMMKGNKGNLFVLQISHIGWAILAVLPILLSNLIQNTYLIIILLILSRNINYLSKIIFEYESSMFL